MTMGFRNRRRPTNARAGECSPTTGRIVVSAVCSIVLVGSYWLAPFLWMSPLAIAGLYAVIFKPELFE